MNKLGREDRVYFVKSCGGILEGVRRDVLTNTQVSNVITDRGKGRSSPVAVGNKQSVCDKNGEKGHARLWKFANVKIFGTGL